MGFKRINYFNDVVDEYGMPTVYRSYLVFSRPARQGEAGPGYAVAKIYPVSRDALQIEQDHVVAEEGPSAAIEVAIAMLRKINAGLTERISDDEGP